MSIAWTKAQQQQQQQSQPCQRTAHWLCYTHPLAPNFAMPWTHVVQVREMVLQAREQPEDSRAYGSLENTTLFGVAAQVGMDV